MMVIGITSRHMAGITAVPPWYIALGLGMIRDIIEMIDTIADHLLVEVIIITGHRNARIIDPTNALL